MPATERVRLARLAEEAVAATEGVAATAGHTGAWVTPDGDRFDPRRRGSPCSPRACRDRSARGRDLAGAATPQRVADALRGRVARSADAAGLGDRLGPVAVSFHDVRAPGERA